LIKVWKKCPSRRKQTVEFGALPSAGAEFFICSSIVAPDHMNHCENYICKYIMEKK